MMALGSIFEVLWKAQKPFVLFRTPGAEQLVLYFQEDTKTHTTTLLEEAGFVMRSFSDAALFFCIPADKKMFFDRPISFQPASKGSISSRLPQEKEAHLALVEKAQRAIASGAIQKVVVSQKFDCPLEDELDPLSLFLSLEKAHSDALVYFWHHPQTGTWLGASPERLLIQSDHRLHTVALAGTLPQSTSPAWTEKEREEQQMVVDAIVDALETVFPSTSIHCSKRYTKPAGNLVHLCTDIRIEDVHIPMHQVLELLHPTPAVGGLPKDKSLAFINKNESYDRRFYTGILGPVAASEKQLFVNLRCAELGIKKLAIYVGGGITAASEPEKEWQEILRKSETILRWI
ncbi:MAG: chorismate-binding protein [Flavobacteriaceae bacterium]